MAGDPPISGAERGVKRAVQRGCRAGRGCLGAPRRERAPVLHGRGCGWGAAGGVVWVCVHKRAISCFIANVSGRSSGVDVSRCSRIVVKDCFHLSASLSCVLAFPLEAR